MVPLVTSNTRTFLSKSFCSPDEVRSLGSFAVLLSSASECVSTTRGVAASPVARWATEPFVAQPVRTIKDVMAKVRQQSQDVFMISLSIVSW
jgi:hypothetical protein